MFSIGFIVGAMIGGFIAIALHCMVIVGKEEDKKWEEEQITKKIMTRNIQKAWKGIGKSIEEDKKQKYYEEKAKDMNNSNVIYNDDPNAVTKLKEKLEYLEKQRALIKADEEHEPWQLQNIGERIRETKRRIARLENLEKIELC